MKNSLLLPLFCLLVFTTGMNTLAQTPQGIVIGDSIYEPHESAILEIRSGNKGFLLPRMSSTQKGDIIGPANGLILYDTTEKSIFYYSDRWEVLGGESLWNEADSTTDIYFNTGLVGIGIDSPKSQLHVSGTFQANYNNYIVATDTLFDLSGNSFQGAMLYKRIDSSKQVLNGIFDATQILGSGELIYMGFVDASEQEDAASAILMTEEQMIFFEDSENQNIASGLMLTKDNLLLGSGDFNFEYGSYLTCSKGLARLQNNNLFSVVNIDIDSTQALLVYTNEDTVNNSVRVNDSGFDVYVSGVEKVQSLVIDINDGFEYTANDNTTSVGFKLLNSSSNTNFSVANNGNTFINGNLGVGTTSPSEKLHVSGNILASGSITEYSDLRLKKNIETISNALEKVTSLKGVMYEWKKDNGDDKKHLGLIAQEVKKVFPELVQTDATGNYSVHYTGMIAPLVEAIKELKNRVELLELENMKLKAEK